MAAADFPSGVTRTLRDAQREILSFVGADTYLVGHSLDSDLKALRLVHRRLIDTSELYPSSRGMPFKVGGCVPVLLCTPCALRVCPHSTPPYLPFALALCRRKFQLESSGCRSLSQVCS